MDAIRDLLNRFRKREEIPYLTQDTLKALYMIMGKCREMLVKSFINIKDRKLREVYDAFSFMMLHYDKLFQFIRRCCGAPLYDDSYTNIDVEPYLAQLPLELAIRMRRVVTYIEMLYKSSSTASSSEIKTLVLELDNAIEDIARTLSRLTR